MKVKKLNTQAPPEVETVEKSFPIVALGASAGGLEALQDFFDNMPSDSGMAFMVIQHLNPTGKSMLGAILQKHTQMVVSHRQDRLLFVQGKFQLLDYLYFQFPELFSCLIFSMPQRVSFAVFSVRIRASLPSSSRLIDFNRRGLPGVEM